MRLDQGVDPSLDRKDCRGLGPPNASIIRMFRAKRSLGTVVPPTAGAAVCKIGFCRHGGSDGAARDGPAAVVPDQYPLTLIARLARPAARLWAVHPWCKW